ncbi:MAG: excinuclease ABC subunit UvrC [Bacteroidetes bacterium]|nr:excinuclease ABC subunit UvrC [Bacteroidota bacterium]
MNLKLLPNQIRNLPDAPGVYRYFDEGGKILYVGKAKNLKKRVNSYFMESANHNNRIRLMVSLIHRIEYTIVHTEYDALLLENSLIKKYQPRYNVSLKDGKSYPFICIKKERFPRVFSVRNPIKDGSEYYGPYSNGTQMRVMLEFLRKIFPLRSCNLLLSKENIEAHKFKVCLDYHIKLCNGPCEAHQTEENYAATITNIRNILKGDTNVVVRHLTAEMEAFAEKLDFENAQNTKEKLESLEHYQAKSMVVNPAIHNVDVFSIYANEKVAFVNYMKVINGSIITTDTIEYTKRLDETDAEILELAIAELRLRYKSLSREIIVPFELDIVDENLEFHVPKIGDKKKLIELSLKNAFSYFESKMLATEINKDKRRNFGLLQEVQADLNLPAPPYHIECFDNSNLQGTNPISSIVVFKNGVPSKKDYRYFNVKTVVGPDDFATMEEAVLRRYKRMLEEETPLPQLIIIDGGKGQLSSAINSLKLLGIEDKVSIISIAKRLEEIYKPHDALPLSINKRSQTLKLIQRIRDEAHRYGITAHRNKRVKTTLTTSMDAIPGIGEKTIQKILTHFKSLTKAKAASQEEMAELIGKSKAEVFFKGVEKNK